MSIRKRGTNTYGQDFRADLIEAVWSKGSPIDGYDARTWRRDKCGRAMKRDQRNREDEYGWEIDHIKPVALGGTDDLTNLQPLHWSNNAKKSDTYPWSCS